MKNALFLQSWYSQITDNWYPWLESELNQKGYLAHFLDIEEFRQNTPQLETIIHGVEAQKIIHKDTVIIGHSLGALVAMRLAERQYFSRLIVVSGWDFDDLTAEHKSFWQTKMNHDHIIQNTLTRHVIHSDNDPYITAFQAEEMSKRLKAKFTLIPGAGHFTTKDGVTQIPELLSLI